VKKPGKVLVTIMVHVQCLIKTRYYWKQEKTEVSCDMPLLGFPDLWEPFFRDRQSETILGLEETLLEQFMWNTMEIF
jgi:hypothetical protein